jgi:hypothetical protein
MAHGPEPDVRYAVEEVLDWDPTGFSSTRDQDGITLRGPCPRCGHDVDKRIRAVVFSFDDAAGGGDPEEDVIRCNCLHMHEGGAAGQGCGRYWGVEIDQR